MSREAGSITEPPPERYDAEQQQYENELHETNGEVDRLANRVTDHHQSVKIQMSIPTPATLARSRPEPRQRRRRGRAG